MTTSYEHITPEQMNGYYLEVCRGMAQSMYDPHVIVALSRGGLDMGMKLSHWFGNSELLPVQWQTRDGVAQEKHLLEQCLSKYSGMLASVLIVDDICDSGQTLISIDEAIADMNLDIDVSYAVAIHNADCEFEPTWWGRTIYRNVDTQWFVFPWEEWWRANP